MVSIVKFSWCLHRFFFSQLQTQSIFIFLQPVHKDTHSFLSLLKRSWLCGLLGRYHRRNGRLKAGKQGDNPIGDSTARPMPGGTHQGQPQPRTLGTSLGMGTDRRQSGTCAHRWTQPGGSMLMGSWRLTPWWCHWGRGWWVQGAGVGSWVMGRVGGDPGRLGKDSQACQCPQGHGNLFCIEKKKKIMFNRTLANDAPGLSDRALGGPAGADDLRRSLPISATLWW